MKSAIGYRNPGLDAACFLRDASCFAAGGYGKVPMTSEGTLVYSIRGLLLKKLTSRGSRHVNGEDSSLRLPMIPRSDKTIRQEPLIKYFNSP